MSTELLTWVKAAEDHFEGALFERNLSLARLIAEDTHDRGFTVEAQHMRDRINMLKN